jgi:hypothetical protein
VFICILYVLILSYLRVRGDLEHHGRIYIHLGIRVLMLLEHDLLETQHESEFSDLGLVPVEVDHRVNLVLRNCQLARAPIILEVILKPSHLALEL